VLPVLAALLVIALRGAARSEFVAGKRTEA
jgi:hypothetical protein